MSDEFAPEPEDIQALLDELDVSEREGDRDWNYEFWIPEYAEPILGQEIFESLEGRFRAIPGIERLAWEDREVFLARVAGGTSREFLLEQVGDIMRAAVTEAGHRLP